MVIKSNTELHECLHKASQITEIDRILAIEDSKDKNMKEEDTLTRILESIFMCHATYIHCNENIRTILHHGITHLVLTRSNSNSNLTNKFEVLHLDSIRNAKKLNPFKITPIIMDFIRRVTLFKGRLLFVENDGDNLIKESVLIAMNHIFKTNIFETYTLIKSQCLFFRIQAERLQIISEWNMYAQKIR